MPVSAKDYGSRRSGWQNTKLTFEQQLISDHLWAQRHLAKLHSKFHVGLKTLKAIVRRDRKLSKGKRRAFAALKKEDVVCGACAAAGTSRKHPNSKNVTGSNTRWTGDATGPFPQSRLGNRWMFVWVDGGGWSEVGFGRHKSDVGRFTMENVPVWSAQSPWGLNSR